MKRAKILGIGSPIMDKILFCDEDFLSKTQAQKGDVIMLDPFLQKQIINRADMAPAKFPGGCAANVLKVLAKFNHDVSLVGKVGDDETGQYYAASLNDKGVSPKLVTSDIPTGQVLVLVTPDGERSFLTYTGSSSEMTSQDLEDEPFKDISLLYLDGYTLLCGDLPFIAAQKAKEEGALIVYDLCSEFISKHYALPFNDLLTDYIDILFCSEAQATKFTQKDLPSTLDYLSKRAGLVVVTQGSLGGWVQKGNERFRYAADAVEAIDSTGAGDIFAGGFLQGIIEEMPIEACAQLGALMGREAVLNIGAELTDDGFKGAYNAFLNSGVFSKV